MDKIQGKITVFFDTYFWIGIFESIENNKLSVAKITFGAEPKNYEVYEFISKKFLKLKFSPTVDTIVKDNKKNPKRIQRELKKQRSTSLKSHEALKLQQEEFKLERKKRSKELKKNKHLLSIN